MACKYNYKGDTYDSYQALLNKLESTDIGTLTQDILYSETPIREIVYDKISALKQESKAEIGGMNMIDGSPDLAHPEGTYTTQTLIDSPIFQVNGEAPLFRLSTEDYVETMKKAYIKNKEKTPEEADAWGDTVQEKWDGIAEDALDFHKLIMSDSSSSLYEWSKKTADTAFAGITEKTKNAEAAIFKQVMLRNGRNKVTGEATSMVIKSLNFQAELKDTAEKILGHIDYLVVRENGDIEIYNVKTSTEPYSQWAVAKKEKYKYQMALLKRMLAFHGVDTTHLRLNIIPVQLKYDNNYETITDINVQNSVSIDTNNLQYTFRPYDNVAAHFIDSNISMDTENNQALVKVSAQLQHIFPGKDIQAQGITLTAKDWVKKRWWQCNPKLLPNNEGWELTDPDTGEVIRVSDTKTAEKNEEFVSIIQDKLNQETLPFAGAMSAHFLRTDIQRSYANGFFTTNMTGSRRAYVASLFSKYLDDKTINSDGKVTYKWKVVKSTLLDAANIIAFQNRDTDQFDVFIISGMNPDEECSFKGRKHILGAYLGDMNDEGFTMRANYGNVEAVRAIALLNEVLPSVGEVKLGQLKVVGLDAHSTRQGVSYDFEDMLKQWDTIVRVVNKNTNAKIVNNFKEHNIGCIKMEDVVLQMWNDISRDIPEIDAAEIKDIKGIMEKKVLVDGSEIAGLASMTTIEGKLEKLEELIERLKKIADDKGINVNDATQLTAMCNSQNRTNANIARLYIVATQALSRYYGDVTMENEEVSTFQEYLAKTSSIANSAVRRVDYLTRKSIDNIRNTILNTYQDNARDVIMQYYEDCGYTKVENSLIGDQARVFKNLYQTDDQGTNIFLFKNPYDMSNDLKTHERTFLKKILYEFHKIRCAMQHKENILSGIDDPMLKADLPKELNHYLYVPLQRASTNTRRMNIKSNIEQWGRRVMRMIHDPSAAVEELEGFIDQKDIDRRDSAIEHMRVYNPYTRSEVSLRERDTFINSKGVNYFETNVENIFIDFMSKQVECEEFNKLLIRIKAIELGLTLKGIDESDEANVRHTTKMIDDYVTLNIYDKPIMEKGSQKIDMWLRPFRRLVSTFYIAGNPVAMTRDILQGLQENFIKAAIKFQTDINAKDVAFGYGQVMREGCTSMMVMTKLNQFNLKYGFSNFDAAKVAERLKSGRGGILNPENWAYYTLRAPDYLNRMTLFIAKLHHDGAYDAYSLDKNGRLKYDWKKDKRFAAYAANDIKNPEYNKQKGLYFSMIKAFNMQSGTSLNYTDDLPDAYTPDQIRAIKTLGETIYGAYDKAAKAKYENIAIGRNFCFFSTWMNGIADTYFKPTQLSQTELKLEQETDYNGNLLFFTADQSGNTTTEDTGIPVYKHVPIMVQGVYQTIRQTFKEMYHNGFDSKTFRENIWSNPVNRRNYKRLMSDAMVALLLFLLFKFWITPAYQEHKKNDEGEQVFTNVAMEYLYKGGKASYDTFKGPMAILTYVGESTNPASYALQTKILSDGWNWAMGNRTTAQTLMGSQAFFRSAQDSYRMWARDHQS